MTVIFYLKGGTRIDWRVTDPATFNFHFLVKMVRADGQFLADGVYVQANEIAAILLEDEAQEPAASIRHRNKVERLVS